MERFHQETQKSQIGHAGEDRLERFSDRKRRERRRKEYIEDGRSSPISRQGAQHTSRPPIFTLIPPEIILRAQEIVAMPRNSREQRLPVLRKSIERQLMDRHYNRDVISQYAKEVGPNPESVAFEFKAVVDDSHGARRDFEQEFIDIWKDSNILTEVSRAMATHFTAINTQNQLVWENSLFEMHSQGPRETDPLPTHTVTVRDKLKGTMTQFMSVVGFVEGSIYYRLHLGNDSNSEFSALVRKVRARNNNYAAGMPSVRRDESGHLIYHNANTRNHVIQIDWGYKTYRSWLADPTQLPCLELDYFLAFFGEETLASLATMNPVEYAILKGLPSLIAQKMTGFLIQNHVRPIATFCVNPYSLRSDTDEHKNQLEALKHNTETQRLETLYRGLFGVHTNEESGEEHPFEVQDHGLWCRRKTLEHALSLQNPACPLMANGALLVAVMAFERFELFSATKADTTPSTGNHRSRDSRELQSLCESMHKARLSFE